MPEQVADFEGRSAVEDEHLVAALEERVGKVRAEETSASGDQNLHKVSWSFGGFVRMTHRHDAARRTDSAPLLAGRSRGDVSWRDLGGWRGARLPRRERASRRRTLDGQGQHGDDNRDGFRFVRWPRVRDTHPRRRQQHDVVIVAIVPETGDPRGIGRTGVCQGPCRGERADEEENEETPNAHGWTHTIGLLRVSSDWGCCGRRLRSRSRRRPRRLTRRYATSSGRATMMPVCVGTRARYVASSSSRMTAFWVVDACSNLTVPPSSL